MSKFFPLFVAILAGSAQAQFLNPDILNDAGSCAATGNCDLVNQAVRERNEMLEDYRRQAEARAREREEQQRAEQQRQAQEKARVGLQRTTVQAIASPADTAASAASPVTRVSRTGRTKTVK